MSVQPASRSHGGPPRLLQKVINIVHRGLFRLSGGRLGGRFFGAPVLVLTTTGRKSAQPRSIPLMYLPDGADQVVIASNGGASAHPDWYKNLSANPNVTVELTGSSHPARAETLSGPERDDYWQRVTTMWSGYAGYQKNTDRQIPLVRLRRISS